MQKRYLFVQVYVWLVLFCCCLWCEAFFPFFLEKCILVILRNEVRSLCPILLMGKRQKKKKEVQRDFIHQGVEKPHWYQMCSTGSAKLGYREVSVGICVGKMRSPYSLKTLCSLKTEIGATGTVELFWPPELSSPRGFEGWGVSLNAFI